MSDIKTPLELYKHLPKTNCGDCGIAACLAFAAAVIKEEKKPADCPHIDRAAADLLEGRIRKQVNIDSIREVQLKELRNQVASIDIASRATLLGAKNNGTTITIKCLGKDFTVDGQGQVASQATRTRGSPCPGLLGTEANSIQPEKRMLSSMTPTIILKDAKPFIIIGSPGGSQIITTVLQVVLNCIRFDMNIREAIEAPRIHHQWMPDSLYYEQGALTEDVKKELTAMGYALVNDGAGFRIIGIAEGILIDQHNKIIYGASDPRGGGLAAGY